MKGNILPYLQKINLFSGLPQPALEKLGSCAHLAHFDDRQVILAQEDKATPVYFISEGAVRIFRSNPEGREQTLSFLRAGDSFNIPTAFFENRLAPASAEAIGNTTLVYISQEDFRRITSENTQIALVVLGDLSNRLQFMTNLVHDVSLRSVRGRLARFLLDQSRTPSSEPAGLTQEQMAARIGTSREVVSRALRSLIRDGLIKTERHNIIILKPDILDSISEE